MECLPDRIERHPVRAPGVNETTVARIREGACPTRTSS